jgi:NADH-quinone oxidoreductase subunit C
VGEKPAEPLKPPAPTPKQEGSRGQQAGYSAAEKPAAPAKPAAHAAPKAPAVMAVSPWEGELPALLRDQFGEQILEFSTYLGQNFLVARPDAVIPILEFLKLEADFDYLVDVTAVDYPQRPDRFDLLYILYSFARNERIRIKTRIPDGFKPQTATGVHLTANWLEREVFDMFGIEFAGHPDMRRILLPDEWDGHPLRKEKSLIDMDNKWVKENIGIDSGQ